MSQVVPESEKYFLPTVSTLYQMVLPWEGGTVVDVNFERTSALDGLAERYERRIFCHLRGDVVSEEIDGAPNAPSGISKVLSASWPGWRLPLAAESVDCVVLHGTLDRVPKAHSRHSGRDPRAVLLDSVHRVLKPAGLIAVAASNRLDPRRFMGPFFRGMSPGVGQRVMAPKTHRGYRRLLQSCRFEITGFYAVLPDYDRPLHVISCEPGSAQAYYARTLSNPKVYNSDLLRRLASGLARLGWLPFLERHFLITAVK